MRVTMLAKWYVGCYLVYLLVNYRSRIILIYIIYNSPPPPPPPTLSGGASLQAGKASLPA